MISVGLLMWPISRQLHEDPCQQPLSKLRQLNSAAIDWLTLTALEVFWMMAFMRETDLALALTTLFPMLLCCAAATTCNQTSSLLRDREGLSIPKGPLRLPLHIDFVFSRSTPASAPALHQLHENIS